MDEPVPDDVSIGDDMAKFLTELDTHLVKGDRIWELDAPLVYESDLLKCTITVPATFQTDFASVPRVPIVYWFWGGRCHREAVIHDYLFRSDSIPVVKWMVANDVFLEAMKARQKSLGVRYPMYWGVCVGSCNLFHVRRVEDRL